MEKNLDAEQILIDFFYDIKKKGWIPTKRRGDECLGNTFEDLIGKSEDNKPEADFMGIELKSHRILTTSFMTLFSKAPTSPKRINLYLRDTYGVEEPKFNKKILNTTVSGDKFNSHRGGHNFKLEIDRKERKLRLIVRRNSDNKILEDKDHGHEIYWNFSVLETALEKKLKKIAVLYGSEKTENGIHYVRYEEMIILEDLTLEKMLSAMEMGELYIDLRIGIYESGKNIGRYHDHGSAFRIMLNDLIKYCVVRRFK